MSPRLRPSRAVPTIQDVQPAPRRPSREARRLIFRYQGTQAALRVCGALFTVVGLAASVVFCWGLPVDVAIALGRGEATATIVSAVTDERLALERRHPTEVGYAYEARGSRWETRLDTFAVPPGGGGTVAIEYASIHPGLSRVAGTTRCHEGWFGLAVLLFPAAGAVMLWSAVRSNRREIRAFVHGRPTLARVTFGGPDRSVRYNGRHPFVVRWEFRAPTGGVCEGALSTMNRDELARFAEAEQVVVLYDPADPRVNTLFVA